MKIYVCCLNKLTLYNFYVVLLYQYLIKVYYFVQNNKVNVVIYVHILGTNTLGFYTVMTECIIYLN